jgi:TolA-binding protein
LQVRQLQAFEQAGQTDKAVELWLALVDELGTHQSVMSLRPTKLAAKGSDANTRAISLLETRKAKLDGKGTLGAAVDSALLELYEVQGRSERAQELAGQIVASQPTGDSGSARRAPAAGSPAAVMTACRSLINGGRAQQALASIEELLPKLGSSDLPEAMYLRGQACEKLAASAQGAEARSQLLSAGLSYMRVFAHFPASREAGEALVGAGRVNAALGNKAAARNAWRAVLNRFPDTPAAEQARKARDSLDK